MLSELNSFSSMTNNENGKEAEEEIEGNPDDALGKVD